MLANLFAFVASWNMSSRRCRACTVVPDTLGCMWVHRDCAIVSAAEMITSAGVADGFGIYLCFKKTVSDTLFAPVEITHMFQQ